MNAISNPTSTIIREYQYVALGGRIGEFNGYGTVWATSTKEARERFEAWMPTDRYVRWQADSPRVQMALDPNWREIDEHGNELRKFRCGSVTYTGA